MKFFRVITNLFNLNRTNWRPILLSFITAIIFWLFNALNKEYTTNLSFPIQFEFDRNQYVSIEPLPQSVVIQVTGNGWDILKRSLHVYLEELIISLKNPTQIKKIVGSTLPAQITEQIPNLTINYVITDTLYVKIDHRKTRKIKIAVEPENYNYVLNFRRSSEINIQPDSIQVTGPESFVKELPDSLPLNQISISDLSEEFDEEIEVSNPHPQQLHYQPASVKVSFKIVQVKQIPYKIKLTLKNTPPDFYREFDQDSITCMLEIPENQVNEFMQDTTQLEAIIDWKEVQKTTEKTHPKITGLPKFVRIIRIDSITIP